MFILVACTAWIELHDLTGRPFPAFPDAIEFITRPNPENKNANSVILFSGNKVAVRETIDEIKEKIKEVRSCQMR